MAELRYDNLLTMLEGYGREVVAKYRAKLAVAGKNASGKLSQTMRSFVEKKGSVVAVYVELQDYWDYLERGTRKQGPYKQQGTPPGKPMRAALLEWVKIKPPFAGKKLSEQKSIAYLIARKIYRDGTRPFWFLRDSLAEIPDIDRRIAEALKADIGTYIQELIAEL